MPSPSSRKILVTGGAGFIGSHAVRKLLQRGHRVEIVDDLSHGHRATVPDRVPFHQIDVRNTRALEKLLEGSGFDAVLHFAAWISVEESVLKPDLFRDNNLGGTRSLLRAMRKAGVRELVFSSTAAVYGEPSEMPINENTPTAPVNPYGQAKLDAEQAIKEWAEGESANRFAVLRYFNVAGASADGDLGEVHEPETHLVPNVLRAALPESPPITLFGDDYPTPDGTCVRDYIHVEDLVDAHAHVLERLEAGDGRTYNLGIGKGFSIREVLNAAKAVTGRSIPYVMGPRRAGDVAELRADPAKIARELGWRAQHTELAPMIESAWNFLRSHPRGYAPSSD